MLHLLPQERRERLARIRTPEKWREPLCAYTLLRLALWEKYQWRELPPIERTALGKPWFPGAPEVHFNISHTDGAVLAALSSEPVGVDIEKIRPVEARVMRRVAGVSEETAFFQSWVRREARTKCTGNGVSTMMRSEAPLEYGEHYYSLDTFPGYAAGIATYSKETPGPVRKYTLEGLLREGLIDFYGADGIIFLE